MVIDLTNPQGKYGGSMQAVAQILQYLGQVEKDRQERDLTDTILSGISAGKDFQSILADVSGKMASPSYAGGPQGMLQRTASAFGPHESRTAQILQSMGLSSLDPRRQATMEATGARADLYGERAETERQMRPVKVAGEMAGVGATAAQEAARRATESLTTQKSQTVEAMRPEQVATQQARTGALQAAAGTQTARQGLLTEQTETERQTRPEEVDAVRALAESRQGRAALTQAQIETLAAMQPEKIAEIQARTGAQAGLGEVRGEQAETVRQTRPGQVAAGEARTGLIQEQAATQREAGRTQVARQGLLAEQTETERQERPEQLEAAQALTAARQGRTALTQAQIETLLSMNPEKIAELQARTDLTQERATTERQSRGAEQGLTEARAGLVQEQAKGLAESRPGVEAQRQAQTQYTQERTETERRKRDLYYPESAAPAKPVEGLEDMWEKFSPEDQTELRAYDERMRRLWPEQRQAWLDKVRSLSK